MVVLLNYTRFENNDHVALSSDKISFGVNDTFFPKRVASLSYYG